MYVERALPDFPEYYTSNELHEPHLICFTKFLVVFLYFVGFWHLGGFAKLSPLHLSVFPAIVQSLRDIALSKKLLLSITFIATSKFGYQPS